MSEPPPPLASRRRHPVHQPLALDGSLTSIVFVTVAARHRRPILACPDASAAILDAWREADAWLIGRYVIMPDHVHFFCAPRTFAIPLERWIRYWKRASAHRWPRPAERPPWQVGFWDRQLRSADSYESKWEYVRNNPVRHGLVATGDAWPFGGEISELPWFGRG